MADFGIPALYVDDVVAVDHVAQLALVNRDPSPEETAVPVDWPIALELVDTGATGVDRAATQVWVDGVLAFDGSAGDIQAGFDGAGATVTEPAGDTLRIVLVPTTIWLSEQLVDVRVVSALLGGGSPLDETYSFTAEDVEAPHILPDDGVQATGQKTFRIDFDEDVVVVDAAGIVVTPQTFPAVPLAVVEAVAVGASVYVTVDIEQTPGATYLVDVSGGVIEDTDGNPTDALETATLLGFQPDAPANRRFLLWYMLPQKNRTEDTTGDLRRFIDCLQEVVDLLLHDIDRFTDLFDIERTPFIAAILADLGNPFDFDIEEIDQRRLASVLVQMYQQKGTPQGIVNAVRFFLGIEIEVVAWNHLYMRLGEARLGDDWILGTSDSRSLYSFDIETDAVLTAEQAVHVRRIAEYMKPAHTHLVAIRDGSGVPEELLWRLGESALGSNTGLS